MSDNKLFSIQSNGYNIDEVDDYLSFIQNELTKNMKINRDIETQKDNLNEKINALENDIQALNKKNVKLYKDCVAFAKRLKSLEVYDIIPSENGYAKPSAATKNENDPENPNTEEAIKQLEKENDDLVNKLNNAFSEIEALKTENANILLENDRLKNFKNDIIDHEILSETSVHDEKIKKPKAQKPKNATAKKKQKNGFVYSFTNIITMFLIIATVCVIFISSLVYIFVKTPDMTLLNYRAFTVQSASMQLDFGLNDVVITKRQNVDTIVAGTAVILQNPHKYGYIIQKITEVNEENGVFTFKAKDKSTNSFFSVPEAKSLYIIKSKIPYIGGIAKYAFTNPLIFVAILLSILLISFLLRLLLLVPKNNNKTQSEEEYPDYSLNI